MATPAHVETVTMPQSLLAPRSSVRSLRPRRMLAALTAAALAVTASVFGAALPASAAGTASISGTVTASDGGAALQGIGVTWFVFDEFGSASGGLTTETASDGSFTLDNLEAGEYTLGFTDASDTYLNAWYGGVDVFDDAQRITLADAEVVVGADVALDAAGMVSGTVLDAVTNDPLENVQVFASFYDEEGGGTFAYATTDVNGEYTIVGMLPALGWVIGFDGSADGYVTEYYDNAPNEFSATPVEVVAGQTTEGIDAALDQGGSITGSVALAANPSTGVGGVEIQAFDDFGNTFYAYTFGDGAFEMLGVPAGEYRLKAVGSGGLLTEWWDAAINSETADIITVTAGGTVPGIDLLLQAGGEITGVVTGPLGEPLESVEVQADPVIGLDILYTATDENGEYRLEGVDSTDYLISFLPAATQNIRSQFWPGSDLRAGATPVAGLAADTVAGIDIQLPAGAVVRGTVFDDVDVIEGIQVYVESSTMQVGRYTSTDENGDWVVSGLPSADDYVVEFFDSSQTYIGEWYNGASTRAEADELGLQAGSTLGDIDATLVRAATVTGTVVDELGDPIADTQVWFAPGGSFGELMRTATTASDGTYELNGVAPGTYRVLTGGVFDGDQAYRTEWFENAYDPQVSDTVELVAGQNVTGFDVELEPNDAPDYPGAVGVDITGEQTGYPTIDFTLPESVTDGFAYGLFATLNVGNNGDGYLGSFFDTLEWPLVESWQGYDGHGRLMVQAFDADGFGPAERELVTLGDGPAIPSTPDPQLVAADGTSFTISWNLDEVGDGVDYWTWDVFTVGEPGEPYVQTGYEPADDPFSETQAISGLEPETEYEIFIMGFRDGTDETTFWGRGLFSTTDGDEVLGLTQTPVPVVSGGPRLGGVLTATSGSWAPAPVALEYQWLRNGATIGGATGVSYAPTIADVGAELSVRVTGSKAGYQTTSRTSLATTPVSDQSTLDDDRLFGDDRYATAVDISSSACSPGVPVVYLATGTGFPDALSAAAAAATLGGPLLVTLPSTIPSVISAELVRLDPDRVVLVGGTGVVSASVEAAVGALLPDAEIERHSGIDRYATSRDIATNAFTPGETPTAVIATGTNVPDALAASAAAGAEGAPVILVNGASTVLDTPTRTLLGALEVERVVIAGGTGVVSAGIESALRTLLGTANVTRLAGTDRYETAVAINDGRFTLASTVYFATGRDFPDALAGAALAGGQGAPLYTVPGTCVPSIVLDSMARLGADRFVMLGGTGVLSAGVASLTSC